MRLTLATYNMHYGIGRDGVTDVGRIVDTVREADIVCLQEVTQHFRGPEDPDNVAALSELLNYYYVFGSGVDVDASTVDDRGRITNRRSTMGNMVASRWPIHSSRKLLLPKHALTNVFDVLRCAVETVIATPAGPLRVYSVHLSAVSAGQRRPQIEALLHEVRDAPANAQAWDGSYRLPQMAAPPDIRIPGNAIIAGDFNFRPDSAEYEHFVGEHHRRHGRLVRHDNFCDAWTVAGHDEVGAVTFVGMPDKKVRPRRIDYAFLSPDLAPMVQRAWIDEAADGSDHLPVFVEFEIEAL